MTPQSNETYQAIHNQENPFPIEHWLAEGGVLFPAQRQFITLPEKLPLDICLYQGGYGCGKTHAAILLGIELAATQPHSIGLVVTKHLATLRDAVMPMYQKILTQLGFESGLDYKIKITKRCIVFANGSQILFRPVGRSKAYKSLECQWMHAEELGELSEDTFQFLLTRLRQPAQTDETYPLRFFGTSTPVAGWMHDYFNPVNPKAPGYRRVTGKTSDNSVISPAYEPMLRATLPEHQHASLLDGLDLVRQVVQGQADSQPFAKKENHQPEPVLTSQITQPFLVDCANKVKTNNRFIPWLNKGRG